ncbi:MAG: type II toxin-antitoxin system RelE/ParE family toxin [Chitinophagales bacterium]
MKIIITKSALRRLELINEYYKLRVDLSVSNKIVSSILDSIDYLKGHPEIGQIEDSLKTLNKNYRYIVQSNYKIVYKIEKSNIYVTDIFDSRRDPNKIIG